MIDAIKEPFIKAKEWILGLIEEAKECGKNLVKQYYRRYKNLTAGKAKDAVLGIRSSGGKGAAVEVGGGNTGGTIRGFSSKRTGNRV